MRNFILVVLAILTSSSASFGSELVIDRIGGFENKRVHICNIESKSLKLDFQLKIKASVAEEAEAAALAIAVDGKIPADPNGQIFDLTDIKIKCLPR